VSAPHRSDLAEGDGRDRRVPPALTEALAASAETTGLAVCAICGVSVGEDDFIRYVFDFSFERDPERRPDPEVVEAHGAGECRECWDSAPAGGAWAKCVRCGRGWGSYSNCPNCRGRVR
jgi:hypothetical protein